MNSKIVLAADLGGTNLRMAAVDKNGQILYRTKRATPNSENIIEIVRAIVEAARECRKNSAGFQIKAIAAAVPGTIDFKNGKVIKAPNLPGLNDFSIIAALEKELGIKAMLENDANAAAIGEHWLGASKNIANSIYLTLGTGVGGGTIIDGKILRGNEGAAGEIGHISVDAHGALCRCGSFGCIEQYASASAIVRLTESLKGKYPGSELNDKSPLSALRVFESATSGDALALEVFRQVGFYLGVAVSSLLNVFNPGVVVIGGGASAGWDVFIPHLRETVRQRAYAGAPEAEKIVRSEMGDDAGILGAARLSFESLDD